MELDRSGGEVRVHVARDEAAPLVCPECGQPMPDYDTRHRKWRHLDTFQLRTLLIADVPRVNCPEHGVRQNDVPWAEEGSSFTALFEALAIDWLAKASIQAVAKQSGLSWDAVDGIMQRGVTRGMARRNPAASMALAVDEKTYNKRHNYLTVASDGHRLAALGLIALVGALDGGVVADGEADRLGEGPAQVAVAALAVVGALFLAVALVLAAPAATVGRVLAGKCL